MYPTKIRQRKILLLALLPLLILSLDFDATAQQKTFFNPKTISPFERQSDELRYGHYQWNYFQRAYPHGEIPYQRRLLALKQLERMRRAIEVPQPSWTSIGPGNIGGRVNSIAIDPVDENIIYLGAAEGGVWKSTDAGESWNPLADDLPSLSMGAIGIDPQNPQIIYIGTGEHNFIHQYGCKPSRSDQYPGAGVFKSADGGANWTQAGEKFSDAIVKIVIDPIATEIIYVASIDGIFKSVDGGVSWMDILSGVATDVVIEESSPSILYAAICKPGGDVNNGIYQSTDAGESWAELTQGLPSGEDISRISLAISLSVPLVLYAGIAYSGIGNIGQGKGDVYKTINGGLNWTITSPEPNPDCYKNTIAIDPTNPDIVYSGALLIYKSTDGGASWVNIDPELSTYVDYHTIAINRANPQTFYTGNDRGVYKSIDGGGSWINLNQGLAITQFYDIAVDPSTASIIYGGCQDNGVLKYLGTLDWIDVDYFNDGGYNAVDYTNPNIIYFENQFARIKKSLDGGTTSFLILNGLDKSRTGFVTPFIIDPKVHDKLYLGTYKLHRTTDGGDL